jgi:deoxyribonuclease V
MNIPHLHDWNVTPDAAIALQKRLAAQLVTDTPHDLSAIRRVAGVDVSVRPDAAGVDQSRAAVVVLDFPSMTVIETVRAEIPTPFPYIPGLLSFREGPVLELAFQQLQHVPDVFIFDGMGRAHPRRIGIAAHMGLWLNLPTIGCGKTWLVGKYDEPPAERGVSSPMVDKGEVIGAALRTRATAKVVYISPGHLCDLASALAITMACTGKYRLPEPIRAAHGAAGRDAD